MRILAPLAAVAVTAALFVVGCGSSPDSTTGEPPAPGQSPYGGEVTTGGDPSADALGDVGEDGPLVGVDDTPDAQGGAPIAGLTASSSMKTTADLNLRKGPATSYSVLLVIPSGSTVTVADPTAQNGFLKITYAGTTGWSSSKYLTSTSTGGGSTGGGSTGGGSTGADPNGSPSPANAVARASLSTGFSYYWGGGAWLDTGATSSNRGSCSGSCPSCTHSGKYGADCSGMVAKAWQFGTKALEINSHPYSTADFVHDVSGKWSTVSRGSLRAGDAMVYNSNGAGHIVLFEKGDGWGASTVYECRGCSYGCVHNTRTFASNYKGIRRAGF